MRGQWIQIFSALAAVIFCAQTALADPSPSTHATINGVELVGRHQVLSAGIAREAMFTLTNHQQRQHVVDIVRLDSFGENEGRAPLPITSERRIVLEPSQELRLPLTYSGTPVGSGMALASLHFELHVTVDGRPLSAIATVSYICRIPVRR